MKKNILLLGILLLVLTNAISQNYAATVQYRNGTKAEGYAKLISKDRVKFRKSLSYKGTKYDFEEFEYVEIRYSQEKIKYVQLPVQGSDRKEIVQELIIGPVSLYSTTNSGYAPTAGNFGTAAGMTAGLGVNYSIENYYLKTQKSDSLIHLGSNQLFSGKFHKKGAEFFADCKELAVRIKIKEKGFRKRNIEEIVKYYNSNCQQ